MQRPGLKTGVRCVMTWGTKYGVYSARRPEGSSPYLAASRHTVTAVDHNYTTTELWYMCVRSVISSSGERLSRGAEATI